MITLLSLGNPVEPPQACPFSFSAGAYAFLAPPGTWNGKRVYLWPGFASDNSQWSQAPFAGLISDLLGAGWQIVEVEVPIPSQSCFFSNGGWQYREQFVAQVNAIMNAVEQAHGAAQNVAGGISFGGLHGMEAFASLGRFKAWFAHMPVTYINQLGASGMGGVGDVRRFNPFWDVPSFAQSKGWLSYGTADATTNGALTAKLAASFSPSVTVQIYQGAPHETTDGQVADMFNFLQTL